MDGDVFLLRFRFSVFIFSGIIKSHPAFETSILNPFRHHEDERTHRLKYSGYSVGVGTCLRETSNCSANCFRASMRSSSCFFRS